MPLVILIIMWHFATSVKSSQNDFISKIATEKDASVFLINWPMKKYRVCCVKLDGTILRGF